MRVISSLEKGLRLLEYIAEKGTVRIAETAKHFGMTNSNMSIFMNTLVKMGLVYKDDAERRYFISNRIHQIAVSAETHFMELIELVARDEMHALHRRFNENVMLAVLSGSTSHYVARIQSNHLIQIVHDDERGFPLHATANGKVILANKDCEFVERYIHAASWHRYTEETITSPQVLLSELDEIRRQCYAVNRGEYEENIMAVAVPITDGAAVVASLVVQYPTFRHRLEDLKEYAPILVEAAARITSKLDTKDSLKEDPHSQAVTHEPRIDGLASP